MTRLIIIVEGDSEREFITKVITPHFQTRQFYNIDCFKIKHSQGGLAKYEHLKKDIIHSVYEQDAVVTTMIDYYGLPSSFPGFNDAMNFTNRTARISFLESKIKEDIELTQNRPFPQLIPYIQLHEFETFIFSSIDAIKSLYEDHRQADIQAIQNIIEQYPNPEDINDNPNTAPSKRLLRLIPGYSKVTDGTMILEEMGLATIRSKCPRFDQWLNTLEHAVR